MCTPYNPDELLRKLIYFHDVVDECRPQLKAGNLEEFEVVHAELVEKHHRPLSLETDTPEILEAHFQEYERFCRLPCNSYYDVCRRSVVAMGALTLMSVHLGPSSDKIMERFMSYISENIRMEAEQAKSTANVFITPVKASLPDVFQLPPISPDTNSLEKSFILDQVNNNLPALIDRLIGRCIGLAEEGEEVWYKLVQCVMSRGGTTFKIAFLNCPSIVIDKQEFLDIVSSSSFLTIEES
ncbi:hypothetical protein BDQ17DRAFT_1431490 [Cyathus striatus]|nr:hypothetical protein BDQ17DRAFT_1431490 [Cyathus striatus]